MPKFTLDNTIPKNLPLLFKDRAKANPDVGLQASQDKDGKFQTFTYQTVYQNVISFALALQELTNMGVNIVRLFLLQKIKMEIFQQEQ